MASLKGLSLFLLLSSPAVTRAASPTASQFARLPLAFERQNVGGHVRYVARGNGYVIGLDGGGAVIGIQAEAGSAAMVAMDFAGARKVPGTAGAELPGKINHLRGSDPKQWQLGLATFGSVTYSDIYPATDVVYRGNQQQMEFDVVLRPGADPKRIRLKFGGAEGLALESDGALLVHSAAGDIRIPLPVIYQDIAGARITIQGKYRLLANHEVGFRLDAYDRGKPLVIDPTIAYASLIGGGTNSTYSQAIALDPSGNAYITGYSYASDFPTTNASFSQSHAAPDGFVTKMDPTGTTLLYSTYIGGAGSDIFYSIALDSTGSAWVTGYSSSTDFPVLNAFQPALNTISGLFDAVALKLDASGSLLYSTYLGSNSTGRGIAVDSSGNAYVGGSVSGFLPTTAGAYSTNFNGGSDGFVTKFNVAGGLVYSTYVGGTGADVANAIAVDAGGSAYVTGYSGSNTFFNAPPGGAYTVNAGLVDAFVAKLNPAGSALGYFTFLGGNQSDFGNAIAVDTSGNAYTAGYTFSANFPTTAGTLQPNSGGGVDGYVAKLNSTGTAFSYVTYLGGARQDMAQGLAIDGSGNVYVTGLTTSSQFPTVAAIQADLPGNSGSLFQTTTSGSSWTHFDSTLPGAVTSVSPAPGSPGTVVASTEFGIYRTTNSGISWTQSSTAAGVQISRSPANSSILYAMVCCASALRSTDGGITWTLQSSPPLFATSIVADALDANTAYSFYPQHLASISKTTDGGLTWNQANAGLPSSSQNINSLVAAADGSLYADIDGFGVYKSTNQAASWAAINIGIGSLTAVLNGLAVSKSNPAVLYKSVNTNLIYVTTNGGGSWSTVPGSAPSPLGALAIDSSNPAFIYAAAAAGSYPTLYVSTNSGATWNTASTGLGIANLTQIVTDPSSSAAYALAPVVTAAFAAKLNPAGTALVYSTYLGNSGFSSGQGIAVNVSGDAFVTGSGYGSFAGTGTSTPIQSNLNDLDGFIIRISSATPACSFTVSPASQLTYSPAALLTYYVVAPSGCAWTASSNQAWASIVNGTSGSGVDFVSVAVTVNNTGATRLATLTIAGQSVSLTQAPASCSYVLGPPNVVLGAAGGTVQSTVTTGAGCPWSVVNNYPSAITVTSGASGTGNGTVLFNVGPTAVSTSRVFSLGVGTASIAITQTGASGVGGALRFIPITPCRVADTRNPTGPFGGPTIAGGTTRVFNIPSSTCAIPSTAQAYSLNVAVVPTSVPLAFLTLWPTGQAQPFVSTINSDGRVKSNAAIVPAGTSGSISAFASNTTDLVLDINGYFIAATDPTGLAFFPITPCRIADTRNANGPLGGPSLGVGQSRTFPVQTACNLPSTAQAYSLNFAAVPPSILAFLTAWPTGQPKPFVSSLNDPTGTVTANAVIVPAGTNGSIDVFASNTTDLVIDINGYFAPMTTGGLSLYGVAPCRVLDTRNSPGSAPITSLDVAVSASGCGIPATAKAHVVNVTVVPPGLLGFITMWPQGTPKPFVSTLNAYDGAITSNLALVPTTNGTISVFANAPTHVVIDISAYFAQ